MEGLVGNSRQRRALKREGSSITIQVAICLSVYHCNPSPLSPTIAVNIAQIEILSSVLYYLTLRGITFNTLSNKTIANPCFYCNCKKLLFNIQGFFYSHLSKRYLATPPFFSHERRPPRPSNPKRSVTSISVSVCGGDCIPKFCEAHTRRG